MHAQASLIYGNLCQNRKPARLITEFWSFSPQSHSLLQPYGSSVLAGVLPVALNCCCDCPAYFWRSFGSGMFLQIQSCFSVHLVIYAVKSQVHLPTSITVALTTIQNLIMKEHNFLPLRNPPRPSLKMVLFSGVLLYTGGVCPLPATTNSCLIIYRRPDRVYAVYTDLSLLTTSTNKNKGFFLT